MGEQGGSGDAPVGRRRGHTRAMVGVARRGWLRLAAVVVLAYVVAMVGLVVATNLSRGLIELEVALFADGDHIPRWLGVAAFAQGLLLLALAVLAAAASVLAGTVEATRSVRSGEDVRPWTPFRRGLRRVPAVVLSLLLLAPVAAFLFVLAMVLLVGSVITVPVALLSGLFWLVRPKRRGEWIRWPILVAVPFALVTAIALRWSLWLPFVVVDGLGTRKALRSSRDEVRTRWIETAFPLGLVAIVAILGIALVRALTAAGVSDTAVGLVSVGVLLFAVGGGTIVVTLLHETYTGSVPRPLHRQVQELVPGFRPSPALVIAIIAGLAAQTLWVAPRDTPTAGAIEPGTYVVNSLADSAAPDLGVECLTPEAECTLRGAVGQLMANPVPGATITFSVDGTIPLVDMLEIRESMVIDGDGHHIVLAHEFAPFPALLVGPPATPPPPGCEPPAECPPPACNPECPPPPPPPSVDVAFRNLTVLGHPSHHARGLLVQGGNVLVERSTFVGNLFETDHGAAIYNVGNLTVLNSTFKDNAGQSGTGGTIWNDGTGLSVTNSTFFDNHGGGVDGNAFTPITIANNLFRNGDGGFNCPSGGYATLTGNLSNDPTCGEASRTNITDLAFDLGLFGDNGGFVDTVPLQDESVAIEAADPAYCPVEDARGEPRPIPPTPCDVGAYQSNAGTTTSISVPENPTGFGSPVQVTVTVQHPVVGATGSVELSGVPGGPLTEPLVGGTASFSVSGLTVGDHTITASYVPDGGLATSTDELVLAIVKQQSTTTLQVTPSGGTSPAGDPVTLTATVRNAMDIAAAQPTGSVDFYSGTELLATATLTGDTATATDVALDGGLHSLTVVYSGDDGFEASTSSAVSHAVQSETVIEVTAPTEAVYGEAFELEAAVSASAGGVPNAIGTVLFKVRTTDLSQSFTAGFATLVDGVATATASTTLPAGEYELTAEYAGDDNHEAAVSEILELMIAAAGTTTDLVGPDDPTVSGEPATFTATVDAAASTQTPTGSVDFSVDGTPTTSVALTDGVAVWEPTDLAVGFLPHVVVATFVPDDANFDDSESEPVAHFVSKGTTTTALDAPATSVAGESVTLEATVTPVAPSTADPAGSVTFRSGTTVLGSATLTGGTASLVVDDLPIGSSPSPRRSRRPPSSTAAPRPASPTPSAAPRPMSRSRPPNPRPSTATA